VTGFDAVDGGRADDCNGHGTHVAGTRYGVAKQARVVAVRVLDCKGSGSTSGIIAGIDWVTRDHKPGAPAVANLSLGGGASWALDQAVQRSIADGVSYVVAAGNGNAVGTPEDACTVSPARVPEALTVGASDSRDQSATFSNYGACVDLYAPGVDIASAWFTSDADSRSISGTPMASPHVAGVAALYLQSHHTASPTAVAQALGRASTKSAVTRPAGSGSILGGLPGSGRSSKHDLIHSNVG
jgi:subtilisin family serine protease